MLATQYGHMQIEWQGVVYTLSPSFINIAKLGNPAEIINVFKDFITEPNPVWKFNQALIVLDACCDIPLPRSLTGRTQLSNKSGRLMYVKPSHDLPMFDDVITMANHCLIHGICGNIKSSKGSGEPLREFDAYLYMELARVHLNMSAEEAKQLTMSEYARMIEAKFPKPVNENVASEKEQEEMLAWLDKQDKKVNI